MFRFPHDVRENLDTAIRTDLIEELWKKPYDRQNNKDGNLWDFVRLNLFFNLSTRLQETQDYASRNDIGLESTTALIAWRKTLQLPDSQSNWRTMMLAYPPVTRAHLNIECFKRPEYIGIPSGIARRDLDIVNTKGVTL